MQLFRTKGNRAVAAALAVLILLSTVIVGTFALNAKHVRPMRLVQPNDFITILPGGVDSVASPNMNMGAVNIEGAAIVKRSGSGFGAEAETTIAADAVAGVLVITTATNTGLINQSINYQVVDPDGIAGYDLPNGGSGFTNKTSGSIAEELAEIKYYKLGMPTGNPENVLQESDYQAFAPAADAVTWISYNPEIVDENMVIQAKGVTLLLGEFTDRWGVTQKVYYLFGVGVMPGSSDLNDLMDAIEKGEALLQEAEENPGQYDADKLIELENAVEEGNRVLDDPTSVNDDYKKAAEDIWNAIDALQPEPDPSITLVPDAGNNGGDDDRWYRPLKNPKHVYEVVDKDGNPQNPPAYIYDVDRDGNPNTGEKRPAYGPKNGIFYVEDPVGSNIYKPVDSDGNLLDEGAIWGGDDHEFGTGDDLPAVKNGGRWFADHGQNIFRELCLDTGGHIDNLFGAGPDGVPGNDDDLNCLIFLYKDGKYYAGPFADDDDDDCFIGDQRFSTNGVNTPGDGSDGPGDLDDTDAIYYMNANGEMVTIKPPSIATGTVLSVMISGQALVEADISQTNHSYTVEVFGTGNFSKEVEWSVTGIDGAKMIWISDAEASLRLPANAMGQVTITVWSKADPDAVDSLDVKIVNPKYWASIPEGGELTIDGIEWIVIGRDMGPTQTDMMIMTKYVYSARNVQWSINQQASAPGYGSSLVKSAVDAFYAPLSELREYAVKSTSWPGSPGANVDSSGVKAGAEMQGILFPLSRTESQVLPVEHRVGYDQKDANKPEDEWTPASYWTRSTNVDMYVWCVNIGGHTESSASTKSHGIRPAVLVNFES